MVNAGIELTNSPIHELHEVPIRDLVEYGDLPKWPAANSGSPSQYLRIDVDTKAEPDTTRARYLLLDQIYMKK